MAKPFVPGIFPEPHTYPKEATVLPRIHKTTFEDEIHERSQGGIVAFFAGPQIVSFYLPRDGNMYDLGNIECIDLPANAVGDCDDISVSWIGVVKGLGACQFIRLDGEILTTDDVVTVAPPQNILSASCG
jgi:hypothetical protein